MITPILREGFPARSLTTLPTLRLAVLSGSRRVRLHLLLQTVPLLQEETVAEGESQNWYNCHPHCCCENILDWVKVKSRFSDFSRLSLIFHTGGT